MLTNLKKGKKKIASKLTKAKKKLHDKTHPPQTMNPKG